MLKVWNLKKYEDDKVKRIIDEFGCSEIMAKLLLSRNIEFEKINKFLNGKIEDIKDPYLIKDMDKFVSRVLQAIVNKEKICIYGDYDVDGITSITIMHRFLSKLNADILYYLPDRLIEGYGVNTQALDEIKKRGCTLVITVDCGITAIEETKYAKSLGMDMLITDHHECGDILPDALGIINPKQSDDKSDFKMHAGVGVAFKCLMALAQKLNLPKESYLEYLDIVAVGTISDIVPLVDENRIISKYGLEAMKNTKNVGLRALINIISFKNIDSTMVSFAMAPRINACGRMGKAHIAVELLLEEDEAKANEIAAKLDELNIKRQQVEKDIYNEAIDMIKKNGLEKKASFVLYGENWHNGVIGIVASRLVNLYYKPVILLTKEQGIIRGSGRCQKGASLYDCLTDCKDSLIQFGGHELAAGLSIEEDKIQEFREQFEEVVKEKTDGLSEQMIDIDAEIKISDLNVNLLKDIHELKPYGQSNNQPLFLYKGLKVEAIRTLKEDKHLKMTLRDGKFLVEALAFSQGERRDELTVGCKIDVVCNVELNTFNTPKTIQFILHDFKKSV